MSDSINRLSYCLVNVCFVLCVEIRVIWFMGEGYGQTVGIEREELRREGKRGHACDRLIDVINILYIFFTHALKILQVAKHIY